MNQIAKKKKRGACCCDAREQVMLATLESRGGPHPDLISEERQTEERNKSNQVETDGWMGGPTQPSSNQRARGDATAVCSCCRAEETGGVRRKKTARSNRGWEVKYGEKPKACRRRSTHADRSCVSRCRSDSSGQAAHSHSSSCGWSAGLEQGTGKKEEAPTSNHKATGRGS